MYRRIAAHACAGIFALIGSTARAEPSLTGQTGLVHMPDARIDDEGMLRFGVAQEDPYFTLWSSVSLSSRLELSGRYIKIDGVPGFPDAPELGDYRDKAFDAKLIAVTERGWRPALAIGAQDYIGTRLFAADYFALSKRLGDFDLTVGRGRERIDGTFGGVRYRPRALPHWDFTLEYDANDYRRDFRSDLSGADRRSGGATYGVGYRSGWWGAQVSYQDGDFAGNVYVSIPLMEREFVPKINEPAPYTAITPRATVEEWRADPRYMRILATALERQDFVDVRVRLRASVLELALTNERISLIGRAVGRAARTALRLGPIDMTELRIVYTDHEQPLLSYDFRDPALLERYFDRHAGFAELVPTVDVRYASADWALALRDETPLVLDDQAYPNLVLAPDSDAFVAAEQRRGTLADFELAPFNARIFFNDPGAPVRYDTFSALGYDRRLSRGLYVTGTARLTLFENVSDIRQPSNSLLPHVRSDIGDYRREGGRLRLNSLLLNRYALARERVYTRWSIGYYEEMYAGAGGQALYLPAEGNWAADLAVDWLRQRAPGEAFGFRDYQVATGIASWHYRFPRYGITATARVGRFLAKDEGVRLELKRRFRSGVEIGGWYTWTNEKDITNPGTPDHPYHDKGLFVSVPLNSMLTKDTRERASLALADYTRDVGQMVISPDDLYGLIEQRLMFGSADYDPLGELDR